MIDFREAGRRLAAKDRSFRDKQMELADAIRLVQNGHDVAVGGCLYSRTPMASLFEVLRQGRTGLTLSRSLMCYEAELFMVRGAARLLRGDRCGLRRGRSTGDLRGIRCAAGRTFHRVGRQRHHR